MGIPFAYPTRVASTLTAMADVGPNEWLVEEMFDQYRADPNSVSESWREFFADYRTEANGHRHRRRAHNAGARGAGASGAHRRKRRRRLRAPAR